MLTQSPAGVPCCQLWTWLINALAALAALLWPDHDEADRSPPRKAQDRAGIERVDGHAFRPARDPRIARRSD
jgi:hypothetical protein